jgi:sigma-B regulation protein RsbU (phosphoserine phosphatase)
VIANRDPLVLSDLSRDPSYVPKFSKDAGYPVGPMVVIPLVRTGELRGVLEVSRRAGSARFGRDAVSYLQALGEDIVLSMSNAFLRTELQKVNAENTLLYSVSVDLGRTLGLEELLPRILDQLASLVPYDAAGIYLIEGKTDQLRWLEHRGFGSDAQDQVRLKLGHGIVGQSAKTGEAIVVDDVRQHPSYVAARVTTLSELVVPIRSTDRKGPRIIGAFNVESDRVAAYGPEDQRRLEAFAGLAAVAIEREWARLLREEKTRIDRELTYARKLQSMFLPRRMPAVPGMLVWGTQLTSIEMSGDYYDVLTIGERDFGLVIADVSGKGVPAALVMASLRAGLISEVRNVYGIEKIVTEVNRFLVESTEQLAFVTMFYGVLNAVDHSITFVNAGHNPPLLIGHGGEPRWLSTGGTVLGAFPDVAFQEDRVVLAPGDTLILYTDGITEAYAARRHEEFGEERLLETVSGLRDKAPPEIGAGILAAARGFTRKEKPDDDQTLLIVQWPLGGGR